MASKKVIDEGFDIAKNIANDVMNAIKGKTEDAVKVAPKKIVVAPKVVVAPVAKVKPAPKVKVAKSKIDLTQDTGTVSPQEFKKTFKIGQPYKDTIGEENTPIKDWDTLSYSDDYWEGSLFGGKDGLPMGNNMEALINSIRKKGLVNPVKVDRNTMEVIDGHHRVMAADDAGKPIKYELVGDKPEVKPLEKTIADEVSVGMTKPKVEAKPTITKDWGYTTPMGEITTADYLKVENKLKNNMPLSDVQKDTLDKYNKYINQLREKKFRVNNETIEILNSLQKRGVPSKYHVAIHNHARDYDPEFRNEIANEYADVLKKLKPTERDAYVNLLGSRNEDFGVDSLDENMLSAEELAIRTKELLSGLDKQQQETLITLLPEWNDTYASLKEAARDL